MASSLKGKKVLVYGLGKSGLSAARFCKEKGASVTGYDSRSDIAFPYGTKALMVKPEEYDLVVISPGIPIPTECREAEVIGEVELAFRHMDRRAVGITGTNGKTSVTELVAHILRLNGLQADAVGNNGRPITEWLLEGHDKSTIAVIELSSFQLETCKTPSLLGAVLLNITEDHLDRYENMTDYAKAKLQIEKCLLPEGKFFSHSSCYQEFCSLFLKKPLFYNDTLSDNFEQENRKAAFSLCELFGVTKEQCMVCISSYKKPPHRLETVAVKDNVTFINDSKGTNIDSVIKAVEAIQGNIYLIAGGKDKGGDYSKWIGPFQNKVQAIAVIGEAAGVLEKLLSPHFRIFACASLLDAAQVLRKQARPGDTILLSPGCASFDMFKNFEERGNQFKNVVSTSL